MCLNAPMLLVVLVVAACGGQARTATSHPTSSVQDQPTTQAAGSPASAVKPWYRRGMRSGGFQSPTGNIRCGPNSKDPTELLCETLNNGNGAVLGLTGLVDTSWKVTIGSGWPVLHYGHYWWSRYFWCDSEFKGTFCRSLYSRHGFLINRDGITDYIWKSVPLHFASSGGGSGTTGGSGSGTGYMVICADGTTSNSGGIQGACSYHGGVAGATSGSYGDDASSGTIPGGSGYPVTCADGTISNSGGIQGACSYHGGVAP
jgi:hypothetical protein